MKKITGNGSIFGLVSLCLLAGPVAAHPDTDGQAVAEEAGHKVHVAREVVVIREAHEAADGSEKPAIRREHRIVIKDGEALSDEERNSLMSTLREDGDVAAMEREAAAGERNVRIAMFKMDDGEGATRIKVKCRSDEAAGAEWTDEGGDSVNLCSTDIESDALSGLEAARAKIADDSQMDVAMRGRVLEALDAEIARFKAGQ